MPVKSCVRKSIVTTTSSYIPLPKKSLLSASKKLNRKNDLSFALFLYLVPLPQSRMSSASVIKELPMATGRFLSQASHSKFLALTLTMMLNCILSPMNQKISSKSVSGLITSCFTPWISPSQVLISQFTFEVSSRFGNLHSSLLKFLCVHFWSFPNSSLLAQC